MSKLRKPVIQTRRDAWVEIDLGNVEHNIKVLKNRLPSNTKIMAVVKADAYGHGSDMIASTLAASGVDSFGVASVDEGIQLRQAGITSEIIVLGTTPGWAVVSAVENDIELSIFNYEHIESCCHAYHRLNKKPKVHIKVDTGMNRIGISHNCCIEFINKVSGLEEVHLAGIFSHLACAEDEEITLKQKSLWEGILAGIKNIKNNDKLSLHLANTSGMLGYKDLNYDLVRIGLGIYGLFPDVNHKSIDMPDLKQVMGLKARVTFIKEVPAYSGISYGHTFIADKPMKIATVPLGYADGVSRGLSNNIYGLINGQKIKQVGNITMDQMMFDVTEVEDICSGDIITLLGEDKGQFISINEWADKLNTINYEITCRLRVRLPRVYCRND